MEWCATRPQLQVRTNADTPEQTANAVAFGADGIGLCRTEHMFFEGDRIDAMREMILADNVEDRKKALAKLLPYQREDFAGIFKELKGLPGHDPVPRSAAARVPAARPRAAERARAEAGHPQSRRSPARARTARIQSDARSPRLPAGHRLSRKSPRCRRAPIFEAAADVQTEGHQSASPKS